MAINASIYLSTDLQKEVESRAKPGTALGSVIRDQAERAFAVLQHETRALANQFTVPEWQVILDSFNGILTDAAFITHIAINVEDNITLNNAAARFGLSEDQENDLILRIGDLSPAKKWAILDVAERFWIASEKGESINADADGLKKLGVVCRD